MRSRGRFQVRLEPALLPASEMPVGLMATCDFHGTGDIDTKVSVTVCSMLICEADEDTQDLEFQLTMIDRPSVLCHRLPRFSCVPMREEWATTPVHLADLFSHPVLLASNICEE